MSAPDYRDVASLRDELMANPAPQPVAPHDWLLKRIAMLPTPADRPGEWRDVSGLRRDAEGDTGDLAPLVLRLLDTTPRLADVREDASESHRTTESGDKREGAIDRVRAWLANPQHPLLMDDVGDVLDELDRRRVAGDKLATAARNVQFGYRVADHALWRWQDKALETWRAIRGDAATDDWAPVPRDGCTDEWCACGPSGTCVKAHPDPDRDPRHGHVTPRSDGLLARCGGPGLCSACRAEERALATAPVDDTAASPGGDGRDPAGEVHRRTYEAVRTSHAHCDRSMCALTRVWVEDVQEIVEVADRIRAEGGNDHA